MGKKKAEAAYDASSIQKLQGLEAVRKRPGMYIGDTQNGNALHKLIDEVVDNSVDEFLAGHCTEVTVTIDDKQEVVVLDNGRGIPVGPHPTEKVDTLELVMCHLHSGGKFDDTQVSAGLHGVGVAAVNAVSEMCLVTVFRDGYQYSQSYERGVPQGPVSRRGKTKCHGTMVRFRRDPEIFTGATSYDAGRVKRRLEELAFLNPGLTIKFEDTRETVPAVAMFKYDGGIQEYLQKLIGKKKGIVPIMHFKDGAGRVEVAMTWVDRDGEDIKCYANNTYNADGGSHLIGLKNALTRLISGYAKEHGMLKGLGEEGITGPDVRDGLVAILSVKMPGLQYSAQTKDKLVSDSAKRAVEDLFNDQVKHWFAENPGAAKRVADRAVLSAKAREAARKARDQVKRKEWMDVSNLPGKLADCQSKDAQECEIFLVEGDSAGGCLAGDTLVKLADGRAIAMRDLVTEHEAGRRHHVYAVNPATGRVEMRPIVRAWKTKTALTVNVTLDHGQVVRCTPDHPFLKRDGSFAPPSVGVALTPLVIRRHRYALTRRMHTGGILIGQHYEMVRHPSGGRSLAHWLAHDENLRQQRYSEPTEPFHRHHLDHNRLNNDPYNIVSLTMREHLKEHAEDSFSTRRSEAYRLYMKERMKELTPELSARAKRQWEDQAYKDFMGAAWRAHYEADETYREANAAQLLRAQKAYWAREDNRQAQAARTTQFYQNNPDAVEGRRIEAVKQWRDPALREWRAQTTSQQWTSDFRAKRKIAIQKTIEKKALALLNNVGFEAYDEARRGKKPNLYYPRLERLLEMLGGKEHLIKSGKYTYNHKIISVEPSGLIEDVYDLEIEGLHNFGLDCGVFVHNSAKSARDRRTQAILPLRGKVLNVERVALEALLENKEIGTIITALGCGIEQTSTFELKKLRYHKVILMADADVDGSHIRTLLLTFFYRSMPQLIYGGHLYLAMPPLYGARLRGQVNDKHFLDEATVQAWLGTLTDPQREAVKLTRYKGLGEMNAGVLAETTMNPENRTLKQVSIGDAVQAERLFEVLMGENVENRRDYIERHALEARNLDL